MRPEPVRPSTDEQIRRCRARIAVGRLEIAGHVELLAGRVHRAAPLLRGIRMLPRLAARYAGLAMALAALLFRKNKALSLGIRAFGLWRVARTAYGALAPARSS